MKKVVGIIGLILLIILAIIFLVFNHKTPVNNTIDNPNGNIVEQPVDKKLYIEVERENIYHKYNKIIIDSETNEGFLYIERKTEDELKNLEIKLTIYDSEDQMIFKKRLSIDNESIQTNGYIKFGFTEDLSNAKTYSIDIESKAYYG